MPNPKLETYKNKATGTVYDYTDAAAQAALADILDGTDIDSFSDVESALATKVDKVSGKGLSTNDYDDTEKAKVAGAFPRSEQAVLGAKNLIPYPYGIHWGAGLTYADNKGIITVNGTPTEAGVYVLGSLKVRKGVSYTLVGGLNDDSDSTQRLWVESSSAFPSGHRLTTSATQYSNPTQIALEDEIVEVRLQIFVGKTYTDAVFKPMLKLTSDPDDTFVIGAMTNRELTDKVQGIINAATNAADFAAFKTAIGNL